MLKFLGKVLQHFFAILIAFGLFLFVGFLVVVGIGTAMQPEPVGVPDRAILVVDLDMQIFDSPDNVDPVEELIGEVRGGTVRRVPLRKVLTALDKAQRDDRIAGLLLTGSFDHGQSMANTLATVTELRDKLAEVRGAGKKIFAYSHTEGLGELYVKSVADVHWMDPFGLIDYRGMATEIAYLGGAFDRFGIEVQVVRAGKFKSAGEAYAQSEMSPEARESLATLLGEIWLSLREGIAGDAGISLAELDALASENPLLGADRALEVGLVDELIRYDEMEETLIDSAGYAPEDKTFRQIGLLDYIAARQPPAGMVDLFVGDKIAVVYAEGTIIDGEGRSDVIGGERFARILRRLRKDDEVKAVVLRVNSPGGSATASEEIAREIELTNAKKPVVVSMGGYAASGGYYISAPAEAIFAQPTTITGSIGVVAMIPSVERLAEDFSVNFETVETNEHGTLWSIFDSKSEEELGFFESRIETTYDAFLGRVASGRGLEPATVEEIAQGRVWSGTAALDNGLVDRFGGLEDAIEHAADLAALGDVYDVIDLPRPQTLEEAIAEALSGGRSISSSLSGVSAAMSERGLESLAEQWGFLRVLNDPYHLYSYDPVRLAW